MKSQIRYAWIGLSAAALLTAMGCSRCCAPAAQSQPNSAAVAQARTRTLPPRIVYDTPAPGTVTEPWHEPMIDVVEVPAQLDPSGTYFIPGHESVVEIRKDRYREATYGERQGTQSATPEAAPLLQPVDEGNE